MNRPHLETAVASECVPNIGLRGRRRRFAMGFVWLAITGAVLAELARRHAGVGTALLVAPFAAITSFYFFQAKEKT